MNTQKSIAGNLSGRRSQVAEAQQMNPFAVHFNEHNEKQVITSLINLACEGNVSAAKLLFERKYGKVPTRVEDKTDTVIRVEYD
jgi:hypothetical protein